MPVTARPSSTFATPRSSQVWVGDARTPLPAARLVDRQRLTLSNTSASHTTLYVGGADVTVATGIAVGPGETLTLDGGERDFYAVADLLGPLVGTLPAAGPMCAASDVLLCAKTAGAVYKSTDLGKSWALTTPIINGSNAPVSELYAYQANIIAVIPGVKTYFSVDAGQTWTAHAYPAEFDTSMVQVTAATNHPVYTQPYNGFKVATVYSFGNPVFTANRQPSPVLGEEVIARGLATFGTWSVVRRSDDGVATYAIKRHSDVGAAAAGETVIWTGQEDYDDGCSVSYSQRSGYFMQDALVVTFTDTVRAYRVRDAQYGLVVQVPFDFPIDSISQSNTFDSAQGPRRVLQGDNQLVLTDEFVTWARSATVSGIRGHAMVGDRLVVCVANPIYPFTAKVFHLPVELALPVSLLEQ